MANIKSSRLWLARKRLTLEQKQIAALLGHQNIPQISRYETGSQVPSLKIAVKLSIIYGLPIRILWGGYYRQCREELEARLKAMNLPSSSVDLDLPDSADYCTYLETMNEERISPADAYKIRRHIKTLIEEHSRKILGN